MSTRDEAGHTDLHGLLEQCSLPLCFIADHHSRLEKQLLTRWLDSAQPLHTGTETPVRCFSDLRDGDTRALGQTMSGMSAETLMIPLQALWLPPDAKERRLRDFLLGNPHNPGWLMQHWLLRRVPERCMLVFGQPASLAELKNRSAQQEQSDLPRFIARQALLSLQRVERQVRGARYKQPRFVKEDILEDQEFRNDMTRIAHKGGQDESALEKEAGGYIRELIPRSTPLGLDLLIRLSRFVYTRGYDRKIEVDPGQIARVRKLAQKHPLVLLCNHRSQVDSFAIYSALYDNDLPHPHTFGGINMKMPIIGSIHRRSGMIFIRRAFSDNAVYKSVLQRYIDYLVSKRFPLLWSIEGGRSRTGKLIPPRYGLLGWLLKAAQRHNESEPLYLLPIAITFEQVADVDAYAHEQRGGTKKPEDLGWFLSYLRSFKTPLGKIHIRFGEPVRAPVGDEVADSELETQKLAFSTMVALNKCTPVTGASLICTLLLGAAPQALTRKELMAELQTLLGYLRHQDHPCTFSTNSDAGQLLEDSLPQLVASGLVRSFAGGIEAVYAVPDTRALDAAYYRNNAIHFMFMGAMSDLALAKLYLEAEGGNALAQFDEELLKLRKLLQWEFFFPEKETFVDLAKTDLQQRCPNWQQKLMAGRTGLREIFLTLDPILGHAILEPYLDSYRVVAEQLASMPADAKFDKPTFIRSCLKTGEQLFLQRQLVSNESIAKSMFETGIKVAADYGLLEGPADELEQNRQLFAGEMRQLGRRTRSLRSLASARRSGILR